MFSCVFKILDNVIFKIHKFQYSQKLFDATNMCRNIILKLLF